MRARSAATNATSRGDRLEARCSAVPAARNSVSSASRAIRTAYMRSPEQRQAAAACARACGADARRPAARPGANRPVTMNGRARASAPDSRAMSSSRRAPAASRGDDAVDGADAQSRHPQQHLAAGAVDVDREVARDAASAQASLGSMSSAEHAGRALRASRSCEAKAVEAQQPVGLVQAVLAHERRRDLGQLRGWMAGRAEGGIVDALKPIGGVERRAGCAGWRCHRCGRRRR